MFFRDSLLFSIWRYLITFQKYIGRKIYLIFAFSFIAATSESIGLLLIIPLLQNLGDDQIDSNNILYKFISFKDFNGPIEIIFCIFLAFLIKCLFTFISYVYIANIRAGLLGQLKKTIFKKYSKAKYSYFESSEVGYLSSVINFQVRAMIQSFYFLSSVIVQFLNALILILIAYIVAPFQAIFALLGGLIIFFGFNYVNKFVRTQSIIYANTEADTSNYVNQFLNAFKYLKSTNQNSFFSIPFNKSADILIKKTRNTGIANGLTSSIRDPIAILIILLMVIIQVKILNLPVAPVFVSILLFYRALNYIIATQICWQQTMEFIGSLEIIDKELKKIDKNIEKNGNIKIKELKKGVLFKDIKLKIDQKQNYILKGISLFIPKNKTIAIVGASGAGKSTIIDLITLNRVPTEGNIYIDDINSLNINKESWRDLIGYVQQENTIFDCSIKQNITMNIDEFSKRKNISEKIKSAAKAANIHDFIESLPEGYLTKTGDKGIKLSGGQRQRICLAREIFRDPKILLLDEATSALDTQNEDIVKKSIQRLKGKLTTVIITHRLASIKFCDYVYVLNKGAIIEEGTYSQLLSNSKSYLNVGKDIKIN